VTAYPRVAPAAGNGNSIYATAVIAARVSAPRLAAVTQVTYNAAGLPSGTARLALETFAAASLPGRSGGR
jgi:hypothetical protein